MNPLLPLDVGHRHHGWAESSFSFLPFLGTLLLLLLLAAFAGLFLWRQGRLRLPGVGGARSPEDDARRILADRFARGDISSDEFIERASTLNWTPGSDTMPTGARKKGR